MKNIWHEIIKGIEVWFNSLTPQNYVDFAWRAAKILLVLIGAKIAVRLGRFLAKSLFDAKKNKTLKMDDKKANTLSSIVRNFVKYVVYFVAGIIILEELGVRTSSVLATAGIGGLAVGFGAQNLVKDVISGFFILFEDQYAVGDFVTIGDVTGTVEEIGLRITKIRGFKGELNIIPNGQVSKVTNFTRGNMVAIVDVSVAYEADVDRAIEIMKKASAEYSAQNADVVEEPQVMGVVELGNSGVVLRLSAKTLPMKQWGVERELRKKIKQAFEENGIEIPYPRMVVIQK